MGGGWWCGRGAADGCVGKERDGKGNDINDPCSIDGEKL